MLPHHLPTHYVSDHLAQVCVRVWCVCVSECSVCLNSQGSLLPHQVTKLSPCVVSTVATTANE